MIYHASMRTDIPAFYSKWFYNRIREGYFCVRNPYNEERITGHVITPDVVDLLMFCTKNPQPMLSNLDLLKNFKQSWHVTITCYQQDIEPNVPPVKEITDAVIFLSKHIGSNRISWRYDPILINEKYSVDYHINVFYNIANVIHEFVDTVIISFVHIYPKLHIIAPFINEVSYQDKLKIIGEFSRIAAKFKIKLKLCGEKIPAVSDIIDQTGCETLADIEQKAGCRVELPTGKPKRSECSCYLGLDVGSYNSCPHLCRYCYANNNVHDIIKAYNTHNPDSPILNGTIRQSDKIITAKDKSYKQQQLNLF